VTDTVFNDRLNFFGKHRNEIDVGATSISKTPLRVTELVEDVSGSKNNRTGNLRPQFFYPIKAAINRAASTNPEQNLAYCLPRYVFRRIALLITRWFFGPLCACLDTANKRGDRLLRGETLPVNA